VIRVEKKCPEHWKWVRLKDISTINPHRPSDLKRADSAATTFVPMEAVDATTGKIVNPLTRPFGEIKKGYTYFIEGDVLFAKITPCMQNGKHCIARGLIDSIGFGTTEFHVLRPGPEVIPEWIHFFLRQPRILQEATNHFTGAVGQQRVPSDFLVFLEIPLPPLAEQKRIAVILNEQMAVVERARKAAEERLEALRSLFKACLRQVLTRSTKILPDEWQWVKLGEVSSIHPGQHIMEADYNYNRIGVGYLTGPSDFGELTAVIEKWTDKPKAFAEPGDVLVTVKGAGVGKANLAPMEKVAIGRQLMAVRAIPNVSIGDFLYFFVITQLTSLSSKALGATVPGLGREDLEALVLPLPPLAEQRGIAAVLHKQMAIVELAKETAELELETINALPASFLHRAFSGDLEN
jgi:type I restriction enzyme S subunit